MNYIKPELLTMGPQSLIQPQHSAKLTLLDRRPQIYIYFSKPSGGISQESVSQNHGTPERKITEDVTYLAARNTIHPRQQLQWGPATTGSLLPAALAGHGAGSTHFSSSVACADSTAGSPLPGCAKAGFEESPTP